MGDALNQRHSTRGRIKRKCIRNDKARVLIASAVRHPFTFLFIWKGINQVDMGGGVYDLAEDCCKKLIFHVRLCPA